MAILRLDEFNKILEANPSEGQKVYWGELLSRAYLCASIGLIRSRRWIQGSLSAIDTENFYSFSANLRGLLESSADICYSIQSVPKSLRKLPCQVDNS